MNEREISRRALLQGSAALAGLVALGFPLEALEVEAAAGEEVVPLARPAATIPRPARAGRDAAGLGGARRPAHLERRSSSPSSTTGSGW